MLLTATAKEKMQKNGLIKTIVPDVDLPGGENVFPYDTFAVHKTGQEIILGRYGYPKKERH